jgi:hypothetical protein
MITRKYSYIFFLFLAGFILAGTGCKKEFLNEPRPTESVTSTDVFSTPAGVRAYFNGIYRNMRRQWANLDASAGGATDAWGYNSINLARENKGLDIVNPGGWYQFDYRQENREPTYRRTRFTWAFFYEHINQLNVLIEGVEASSFSAADKSAFTAEARALRAWLYFELIREFQHVVTKDPNAPGIPIYTVPTGIENKGNPRGTIKQVYDLINADIDYATKNLGTDRALKSQVNLNVAWGMAARIYLEQQRWADAVNAAQKAREGYTLDAASYRGNFPGLTSSEVIWGFLQTQEGGGQTLYYGTPSSFYEQTGNGYDNFFMNSTFVQSFSLTDVRNTFYFRSANPASSLRYATNKFGSASTTDVLLITGQTVKLRETDFNESLTMMRAAEMYLIEAEAEAELGNTQKAKTLLFTLQKNRDAAAVQSTNTGAALINEILLERRKELYGELGISWLDIKRRQLPLVRTGNHPAAYRFSFPANDPRLITKLPQNEIDTNENISESDQNP